MPTSSNSSNPGVSLFVTVFLITMIVATAVTFILPESYASTVRIKVNRIPVNGTPDLDSAALIGISSPEVLDRVIEKLGLNMSWGRKYFNGETLSTDKTCTILRDRLTLASLPNTDIVAITVYNEDRQEAAQIANGIADAYLDYCAETKPAGDGQPVDQRIIADPPTQIIERAVPANQPAKPNKPLDIALGGAAGLILGAFAAGIAGFFRR